LFEKCAVREDGPLDRSTADALSQVLVLLTVHIDDKVEFVVVSHARL
jgi:hypothetical protein